MGKCIPVCFFNAKLSRLRYRGKAVHRLCSTM